MRFVLINGPKRSGKDTAAKALVASRNDVVRIGFADHLKNATHAAYGMPEVQFDRFEAVKDSPREEFFGLTPRAAYIAHSEQYMKPLHGKDVFGRIFMRAANFARAPVIAVPDSGFASEVEPLIEAVGREQILLLRIHREGHDFTGDSRSYIDLPGVTTIDLVNNGVQAYCAAVRSHVMAWTGSAGD